MSGHVHLDPQDVVATLLQSFSASFDGACIEIVWHLDECDEEATFIVMRNDETSEGFEELPGDPEREHLTFAFRDTHIEHGTSYRYRVEYADGATRMILFETEAITVPALLLTLFQNHPNPFNPSTTIRYYLPEQSRVTLDVFDVAGRLVVRLVEMHDEQGYKTVRWDGRDGAGSEIASGMYFYRLVAGKEILTRKMIMLK
jgi:hypothetical protein